MDSNEKMANKLYEKGGCSEVVNACFSGGLRYDEYDYCEPCDSEQPMYKQACLCCGSPYEKEYSVTVTASFGTMAVSQESANDYILDQFQSGNTGYTGCVEVDNGDV